MGLKIPALLDAILEATAAEASAKARITSLRATLDVEARRRYADEGAAPTWNAPKLGRVRFDPPGDPTPVVADSDRFAEWVAEQYPTEVVEALTVAPEDVDAARRALGFAGVPCDVTAAVRPAWSAPFLEGLEVEVARNPEDRDLCPFPHPAEEPCTKAHPGHVSWETVYTVVDPASGEVIPGLSATQGAGKLVVSLDPDRKRRALEDARTAAELTVEAATEGPVPDPIVDPYEVIGEPLADDPDESLTEAQRFAKTAPSVIAIMDVGSREDLRRYAKAHGVPAYGTKGDQAIRLSAASHTVDAITRWVEDNPPTQEPTP